jgi:hypothetical protein
MVLMLFLFVLIIIKNINLQSYINFFKCTKICVNLSEVKFCNENVMYFCGVLSIAIVDCTTLNFAVAAVVFRCQRPPHRDPYSNVVPIPGWRRSCLAPCPGLYF